MYDISALGRWIVSVVFIIVFIIIYVRLYRLGPHTTRSKKPLGPVRVPRERDHQLPGKTGRSRRVPHERLEHRQRADLLLRGPPRDVAADSGSPGANNRQLSTVKQIHGIHGPYGYESGSVFGALIGCHVEDSHLCSISHPYSRTKIWWMGDLELSKELIERLHSTINSQELQMYQDRAEAQ